MIIICNYRQISIDRPVVHTFFRHIIFELCIREERAGGSERSYLSKKSGYPWSIYRGVTIVGRHIKITFSKAVDIRNFIWKNYA